jgi:protein tyrosine phosphatase (PTP) superfamily phosphohydrolase (DUF442 family)
MTRTWIAAVVMLTAAFVPAAHAQQKIGEHLKASEIEPGLWRGHAPYFRDSYEELRQLGVRTVLDLRGNQPVASFIERRRVEAMGLTYRKVPFGFQPLRDGSDAAVLAALQNRGDYPMYVHCNIDRDRTAVAVAAYRVRVQGWAAADAQAEAKSFGLKRYFLGLNRYLRRLGE